MNTNTLLYIIVLSVLWLLCLFLKPVRLRQILILIASYGLYASWGIGYAGVLLLSSIVNYTIGMSLRRSQRSAQLWFGIVVNVLLLSIFKYTPELSFGHLWPTHFGFLSKIAMPMGISFWTFQALSYLFDVYRGEELDPTFIEFLLYMAFWPTVLSGPVCRLSNLLPQFRKRAIAQSKEVLSGFDRIALGLLMIAIGQTMTSGLRDRTGLDAAFDGSFGSRSATDVWIMAIGYGFQLFYNFAGYSHIVIGAAQLFGVRLDENFNHPYLSLSPSEFWTRWHMSLSSWIRDYVFLPMVMIRREKWWRNVVLVLAMVLFGLWHRGTVLFILWGLYHGLLLVLHRQWQEVRRRFGDISIARYADVLAWPVTFGAICTGWLLFRANSVTDALTMLRALVTPAKYLVHSLPPGLYLLISACVIGYFTALMATRFARKFFQHLPASLEVRMALYSVVVYIAFLHTAQTQAFVYFQF